MKPLIFFSLLFFSTLTFAQKETKFAGFIENKGQIVDQKGKPNASVLYLLNSPGLNVALKKNSFSYDIYEAKSEIAENLDDTNLTKPFLTKYTSHRIDINFIGSNSNTELIAEGKSVDYDNYYTVRHIPEGIVNVHKFKKITYKNIYSKIDVAFFIPEDSTKIVEYNFIIHPGGKISDIKMKFNGAKTALIDNKIIINVRYGELEETLPMSWTINDSLKEVVDIKYKKIKNNVYGFEGNDFCQKTLIIDPVPVRLWGTYYGGEIGSVNGGITNDINNNVYISGSTASQTNIATSGTHESNYSTLSNGFIAKINSDGGRIWGTYYACNTNKIVIDNNFNVIFCGSSFSDITNLSTPDSYQPNKNNFTDAYIIKLSSSGIREWGTWYGANEHDHGNSVAVDSHNNIYLSGHTRSFSGIATAGSFQAYKSSNPDDYDAFILKMSPEGNRIWSSYYGGDSYDSFTECNINDNFLYVVGTTSSSSEISTPGSYKSVMEVQDGMIIKFTLEGQRVWGTYIGGDGSDQLTKATFVNNKIFFAGRTRSENGIATQNAHLTELPPLLSGRSTTFIMSFDAVSQTKEWGTYFYDDINSVSANQNGEAYISGSTSLDTGISTPGSYMPIRGSYLKAYLIKYDSQGGKNWGTYYGGEKAEQLIYNICDNNNDVYMYGNSFGSTTGITTPVNMIQSTLRFNGTAAFLVKFRDCMSTTTISSNSPVCLGNTVELFANGGASYSWTGPNGFVSTSQNPIILNATALNNGTYFCSITGSGACDDTVSINVIVGNTGEITPTLSILPTISGNCNSLTILPPTARDECNSLITGTTTSPTLFTTEGTYNIVWNYINGNGTTKTQNQTVIVNPEPLPIVSQNPFLCQNVTHTISDLVKLSDISITGQNIKWYDALTGGNLLPLTTRLENGVTYYASQTISGCESARIAVSPTIQETASPIGFAVQYFCDTETLTVQNLVVTGTDVVFYDDRYAGTILPFSTPLVDGVIYWASQTINGCKSYVRLPVMVDILNGIPANDYQVLICDELNDGQENVALSSFNSNLIANTNLYSFEYYHTFEGANTGNASDKINDFDTFRLTSGDNTVYVKIGMNAICFKIVALKLTVISSPILSMKELFSLCENNNVTIFADAGYRYLWSNGATTPSITVSTAGNYWVTFFKDHGSVVCSTTKHFQVVISNKATIDNISVQDWTANDNTISVFVSGDGDYEYSLDGVNYQTSNQFNGLASGEYRIYVNDKNGCGLTWKDLFLLMYPKFFTPNNDGVNDFWKIKFSSIEPGLSVKIFDRYGKFIKEIGHDDIGWDGTYNNQPLPATDYWFVVTRANGNEHRGHFSLKR